jgi:hypothetical protein
MKKAIISNLYKFPPNQNFTRKSIKSTDHVIIRLVRSVTKDYLIRFEMCDNVKALNVCGTKQIVISLFFF